jgi:predicted DNA-binding transcriptional regulator YafY
VRGRWYLVGHDRDRGARRTFRVDRMQGEIERSEPGSVTVPPDADLRPSAAVPFGGGDTAVTVALAFDRPYDTAAIERIGDDIAVDDLPDGRRRVAFAASDLSVVRSFVLEFLEHCEVLSPPELRSDVIAWLTAVAEESR